MKLRIEEILNQKKITKAHLAELMGVTPANITITLKRNNPTTGFLERCAEALGVEIYELFISPSNMAMERRRRYGLIPEVNTIQSHCPCCGELICINLSHQE